jgi:hypothetical protein
MSDIITEDNTDGIDTVDATKPKKPRRRVRPKKRHPRRTLPEIPLPDGDKLVPRAVLAKETVGVCERTFKRWRLPVTYIGGVAYSPVNASLQIIADSVRRPGEPEPPPKRRRRRRP